MNNLNRAIMKQLRSLLLVVSLLIAGPLMGSAQPQIVLDSAESAQFTQTLTEKTQALLVAMDQYSRTGSAEFADEPGIADARAILEQRELRLTRDTLYSQVIRVGTEGFELRQLFMQYGPLAHEFVELAIRFDSLGRIVRVEEANELQNFARVLIRNIPAEQGDYNRVVAVLEDFASAFTNKDAQRLQEFFSTDALIISGSVRGGQTILTRTDRDEYLERLETAVFPNNESVAVTFDQIEVFVNPGYRNVFGVTAYQYWNTSNYSDEGYLGFMVDLRDDDNPKILIRQWQTDLFEVEELTVVETEPKDLALLQGEITAAEKGSLVINIIADEDAASLLNASLIQTWLEDEIMEVSGINVRTSDIQIESENRLVIPFDTDEFSQLVALRIYDTALLSSLRAELRIVSNHRHDLDLYVLAQGEQAPQAVAFADLLIEGQPQGAQVQLVLASDSTLVFEQILEEPFLFQRIAPSNYILRAEKTGYETFETEFSLGAHSYETIRFSLNRTPVAVAPKPEEKEKAAGFIANNRLLLLAGAAATTVTVAAILVFSGSDSGSDVSFFPPPPGRP